MAKISYATYIKDRITGFDGDSPRRPPTDLEDFPSSSAARPRAAGRRRTAATLRRRGQAADPGPARGRPASVRGRPGAPRLAVGLHERRLAGVIALFQPNDFYPDDDAYLEALAEAMRPEYEAIVAAG